MNRIAIIAAVVSLSAAPAFAATSTNDHPADTPPIHQSTANQQPAADQVPAQPQNQMNRQSQQVKLDQKQSQLDRQQMEPQQAQLDRRMDQGKSNGAQAMDTQASARKATWRADRSRNLRERIDWRANQETKALNLLEAQGFTRFRDFRAVGNDIYAANVLHHGQRMTVDVNPQTSQITRG